MSKKIQNVLAIIFWIIVWEIGSRIVNLELLLPSPLVTLKTLFNLLLVKDFYYSIALTIIRVLLGFGLGLIIGLLFAVIAHVNKTFKIIISPLIRAIHVIPVASFIVLLLVWINNSYVPIITGILIVVPIAYNNITQGLFNIDQDLLMTANLFDLSFIDKIKYLYIKELKGYINSSISSSLGMSFKATIAAEVIASSKLSLGRGISQSKLYLETADLFAYTFTILVLSIIVEKLVVKMMEAFNND